MKVLKAVKALPVLILLGTLPQASTALIGGKVDVDKRFLGTVKLGRFGKACSAVKISPTFYLTAAHCLNGFGDPEVLKGLRTRSASDGDPQFYSDTITSYGEQFAVIAKDVHLHPSWVKKVSPRATTTEIAEAASQGDVSDLALLEVEADPDSKNRALIPVGKLVFEKLPENRLLKVHIGGYGDTKEASSFSVLNPSFATVMARLFTKDFAFMTTAEAISPKDGITPLKNSVLLRSGDSGGPAYLEADGTFFVIGINSGGIGSGPNELGTLARLDTSKEWICKIVPLTECR